jgi:MtN3 and saliva related transmembrane protein
MELAIPSFPRRHPSMSDNLFLIGGVAAFLSSLSYIPQVLKAWPRGATHDLSAGMLIALTAGLTLWVVYGVFRQDWVIVCANAVGALLAAVVLLCKARDSFFQT